MSIATVATEHAARARAVDVAVHSAAMEGLTVTPATQADMGEYAQGAIDLVELRARIDARYSGV